MKIFFLIVGIAITTISNAIGQKREIPFVLLIDNNVPVSTISDSYFLIKFNDDKKEIKIPFYYYVGAIIFDDQYYDLLLNNYSNKLSIHFKYFDFVSHNKISYAKSIAGGTFSTKYMILSIFNYFNKESRKKYVIPKDGYVARIQGPSISEVLSQWKR